ncbi:MAG: hypothetical protein MSC30_18205, partial [Gaiellaceae bacterium MAG52_C11]|nr:hypothetical protein [Candidatus Gaiellasilicea maunaloa]
DVDQTSKADADSKASNQNKARQDIREGQNGHQQQVGRDDNCGCEHPTHHCDCQHSHGCGCQPRHDECGCTNGDSTQTQESSQNQAASNSIEQTARSKALALNVAPNVARLNKGDVDQTSEADADSTATNRNSSMQTIDQGQASLQKQGLL